MDEPMASLDQASRLEILPYLERLHDELAMPVLARITRKSASVLGLEPGKPVYAQVKSVALLGGL
jgi:ABC-type molybdate transport system ATPase subunit